MKYIKLLFKTSLLLLVRTLAPKKYSIFLILIFGIGNIASAQKSYFKTYFSGSNIYDVVENDSSFWYITESKILNENKSTKKITYYQLPDKNFIYDYEHFKFLKDSSGKLWVGGEIGLYYLSNDKWIKHPKFNKPRTYIKMFCSDPISGIWFANCDIDQLYHLDGDSITSIPLNSSNLKNVFYFDKKKDLWVDYNITNYTRGICRIRDTFVIEPKFSDTSWKANLILSAFLDKDNVLYISGIAIKNLNFGISSDFLIKYANGVWTEIFAPIRSLYEPSKLKNITIEANGTKWLTTRNFLLNFSSDTLKYHTLMSSYISIVKCLSNNRLLVGTKKPEFPIMGVGDGAWIFKNGKIVDSLKLGTGKFNTNEIIALSLDHDSTLWVAGLEDHLSLKTKNGWKEHFPNDISVPIMPDVILQKKDTTIVLGENGVHYWYDQAWHFLPMDFYGIKHGIIGNNGNVFLSAYYRDVCEVNLENTKCYSNLKFSNYNSHDFEKPLCKDKFGRVWVGSGNFLYHTNDTGGWTKVNTSGWGWPELGDKTVMNFDSRNHLWITTGNYDIYEFNGKYMVKHKPNYFEKKKTYPYYMGNVMITDTLGNIYIGCYNDGLYRYDGKNWFVYDTSNSGLLNNNVNAIALKNNGFWLGTDLGLVDFTNFGPGKLISNTTDTVADVNNFTRLENIQLYPNPTNSTIHIEGLSTGNYKIVNYLGQILSTDKFTNSINVEFLNPGIYSIIIENKKEQHQLKFVKE